MGRKPNPLILQRFTRGAKLADASNRYEFACKACGARFPKGRTDSLVNHLTHKKVEKRCSQISAADVEHIKSVIEEEKARKDQDKNEKATLKSARSGSAPNDPIDVDATALGSSITLPITERRSLTGLEALAEASRQVERPDEFEGGIDEESLIDPNLKDIEQRVQTELSKSLGYSNPSTLAFAANLSDIAASASNLEASMPRVAAAHQDEDEFDVPDDSQESQVLRQAQTWHGQTSTSDEIPTEMIARTSTYPRPIAANQNGHSRSRGPNGEPPKKIRKSFNPEEREKVKGVRKIGSCVRCKMLRKVCDDSDPCGSCAKVGTARLWKSACTRMRLADSLPHFAIGIFESIAIGQAKDVGTNYVVSDQGGEIILRHLRRPELSVAIKSYRGEPNLPEGSQVTGAPMPLVMPSESANALETKLASFIAPVAQNGGECETLEILRLTVGMAQNLSLQMRVNVGTPEEKLDTVILEAIEVWNLTCILTSPHLPFHMAYSAHPTSDGHDPAEELPIPIPNTIPPDNGPSPDAILASTFLARFERRAEGLCRSLLREIESRLMRGKKHGMDVFFVGMLVLASLARIEWFVRGFELEDKAHLWPLTEPPAKYVASAETCATFLCDLLKQRHVIPRVIEDPESGFLCTVDGEDLAKEWYKSTKIRESDLRAYRNAAFVYDDPKSLEMKYCAQMLLS